MRKEEDVLGQSTAIENCIAEGCFGEGAVGDRSVTRRNGTGVSTKSSIINSNSSRNSSKLGRIYPRGRKKLEEAERERSSNLVEGMNGSVREALLRSVLVGEGSGERLLCSRPQPLNQQAHEQKQIEQRAEGSLNVET
jgi:hypothetical protein